MNGASVCVSECRCLCANKSTKCGVATEKWTINRVAMARNGKIWNGRDERAHTRVHRMRPEPLPVESWVEENLKMVWLFNCFLFRSLFCCGSRDTFVLDVTANVHSTKRSHWNWRTTEIGENASKWSEIPTKMTSMSTFCLPFCRITYLKKRAAIRCFAMPSHTALTSHTTNNKAGNWGQLCA